jgi:hypothetical protein
LRKRKSLSGEVGPVIKDPNYRPNLLGFEPDGEVGHLRDELAFGAGVNVGKGLLRSGIRPPLSLPQDRTTSGITATLIVCAGGGRLSVFSVPDPDIHRSYERRCRRMRTRGSIRSTRQGQSGSGLCAGHVRRKFYDLKVLINLRSP